MTRDITPDNRAVVSATQIEDACISAHKALEVLRTILVLIVDVDEAWSADWSLEKRWTVIKELDKRIERIATPTADAVFDAKVCLVAFFSNIYELERIRLGPVQAGIIRALNVAGNKVLPVAEALSAD
ncbi:MAG: hypothetical protein QM739_14930 [Propionivibrio sp.]